MSGRPPSGTVTFLFTDIQDSTRLWEEAPADMAAARAGPRRHRPRGDRTPRRLRVRHRRRRLLRRVLHGGERGLRCDRIPAGAARRPRHRLRCPDGFAHRGRDRARSELPRKRGEPRRAADGARPRRSGSRLRHDRGPAAEPRGAATPGRALAARSAWADRGVPAHRRRASVGVPRAPQRGRLRRQPAEAAELPRRPRGARRRGRRARAVQPAGHAERRRRCRQDSAGPRGRRGAGG